MSDDLRPDAFDVLRRPDAPIAPNDAFAKRLHQRLTTELAPLLEPAITPVIAPERPTTMTITPYLAVRGAVAALDFYRDAFGAVETQRLVGDDGRIGHAEITIGGARVMLADEYPEVDALGPQTRGGPSCTFDLDVVAADRVDALYERAIELGATGLRPPADQFHGSRSATLADPFGHRWTLSALVEQLTTAEYAARAAEDSGHGSFALQTPGQAAGTADGTSSDAPVDHQLRHHDTGDLYYFTLPVADLGRAQQFYAAVLGWQFAGPDQGHVDNIGAPPGGLDAATSDAGARLWFVVDDIHRAVATVREMGGTAGDPVQYPSGWSADCTDDQGTVFSLSVPSAEYSI
jgi:uncharacterized glyoxalase superfamily protein PhnB